MYCSQNRPHRTGWVPALAHPDSCRWVARLIVFLAGAALLWISPSHHEHRSLELLAATLFLSISLASVAMDLLLTFAAKTVRPRKLGND